MTTTPTLVDEMGVQWALDEGWQIVDPDNTEKDYVKAAWNQARVKYLRLEKTDPQAAGTAKQMLAVGAQAAKKNSEPVVFPNTSSPHLAVFCKVTKGPDSEWKPKFALDLWQSGSTHVVSVDWIV